MFSEQFFDLLLNFGKDWKVEAVKINHQTEEVNVYMRYVGLRAECPETLEQCSIYESDHSTIFKYLSLCFINYFINF
ncbi:MAG: hypothetical protein L3J41_16030 [Melioribacteraceae bacterium]|nr:hypothetical protein [Melioribacteraceae bacterium]